MFSLDGDRGDGLQAGAAVAILGLGPFPRPGAAPDDVTWSRK